MVSMRGQHGVESTHEPSRIEQRLVTCNLSLVTGDLQRSGPSVSQSPVTSYQLPVTSLMGVSLRGSWSQCAPILAWRLSMNHCSPVVVGAVVSHHSFTHRLIQTLSLCPPTCLSQGFP